MQKIIFLLENPLFPRSQGDLEQITSQRQLLDRIQQIYFGDEADDGEVFFLTGFKFQLAKL